MEKITSTADKRSSTTPIGSFTVRVDETNLPDDVSAYTKTEYTLYPAGRNYVLSVVSEFKDADEPLADTDKTNYYATPKELKDWMLKRAHDPEIINSEKNSTSFHLFQNTLQQKTKSKIASISF